MKNDLTYQNIKRLCFNHRFFEGKEGLKTLAAELHGSGDEEKKYIATFLLAWADDSPTITLQTSGSTGQPKQIEVRKAAMLASAERTIAFFKLERGDKALLCLSAKYVAGKMMLVRAMLAGLNLLYNGISSSPLLNLEERVKFVAMVPLQVAESLKASPHKLKFMDQLLVGGGALSVTLAQQLKELAVNAWESYGMTETVSHIALRRVGLGRIPFQLLEGFQIIKDDRGCLMLEPSNVNDQTLVTNDVIELETDTTFFLKGRADNVINSGGVKVHPEEIERILQPHFVDKIAVVGLPDDKLGEKVVLIIENSDTIYDPLLFDGLEAYNRPKEVRYHRPFPLTETGKIIRWKLAQLVQQKNH